MACNFSGTLSTAEKTEGVGIGVQEAVGVGVGVGVEASVVGANQNRGVIEIARTGIKKNIMPFIAAVSIFLFAQ